MKLRHLSWEPSSRGLIMGILNVTPDSFSDGGRYHRVEEAVAQAERMIQEGADMLDLGGESTRPGYQAVSAEEEAARVLPLLRALRARFDLPISIDTMKAEVLEAALDAGADIANDIWGLRDEAMARLVARRNVPVVLMHNKEHNRYEDLIPDLLRELQTSLERAVSFGVRPEQIILDPGLGFALDYEKDLSVLRHLEELVAMGYPVLVGASRKRFVGRATHVSEASKRGPGTAATTVVGRMKGASIFRVHDVAINRQALDMTDAILQGGHYGSY